MRLWSKTQHQSALTYVKQKYEYNILLAHLLNAQLFTETMFWFDNITSSSLSKVGSLSIQQGEERIGIVSPFATKKHHLPFLSPSSLLKYYTQVMQMTH